jgi:enoyl-CoA hydratase/3-hydroxyacyl-CoA dehydrogenase
MALRQAMTLVDQGFPLDLRKGLQLELDGLKKIFATEDARTGLSSILTGKKPNFTGK